jgi:type VI protein secretion system component VasK
MLLKLLGSIKAYWSIGVGLLVAGLVFATKILLAKNSKITKKLETAEAKIQHSKVVAAKKKETAEELKSRTAELAKELEDKKTSSELEKPNEW